MIVAQAPERAVYGVQHVLAREPAVPRPCAHRAEALGREDELARLRVVYDAAVAPPAARLAVLLGSPGLGKSRLIDELGRRLGDAATVLVAHCDAAGGGTFAPLVAALRAHLETAARSRETAADRKPLLRITETSWFRHEHPRPSSSVWQRPDVKSPANCGACHREAEVGDYRERSLRVPKTGEPK